MNKQENNTQEKDQVVINLEQLFGVDSGQMTVKTSEINDGMLDGLNEDDYLPEFAKRVTEAFTKEELGFTFAMQMRLLKHMYEQLQQLKLENVLSQLRG